MRGAECAAGRNYRADRLYRHLTCPSCESYLRGQYWVAAYTAQEFRGNRRWQSFLRDHTNQFEGFHRFVSSYPGLGGLHPFGQRLAVAVKHPTITGLQPAIWYRALPYGDGHVPPEHFLPADPRRSARPVGRFNYAGQLGYYVADSLEAAAAEALKWSGTPPVGAETRAFTTCGPLRSP